MFSEQTVKLADEYMAYFAAFTLPGLAAMDYAFGRGLGAGGVDNFYMFVLLLVWSVALSVPFIALVMVTLRPHTLHTGEDPYGSNLPKTLNRSLLFFLVMILVNYMMFNTCEFYLSEYVRQFVALDTTATLFAIAGICTFLLAIPLGWLYRRLLPLLRASR